MTIRPAQKRDIKGILRLLEAENGHVLPRQLPEELPNFVVATHKNKIIGCGSFENYAPKIAEIRSLVVDPEWRNQGVGADIVNELLNWASLNQEVFVVTSTPGFFKPLGFSYSLNEKQILFLKKDQDSYYLCEKCGKQKYPKADTKEMTGITVIFGTCPNCRVKNKTLIPQSDFQYASGKYWLFD